ncbi:MAG: hypothetical protein V4503_05750 [Gemmatimonadota bacterium]
MKILPPLLLLISLLACTAHSPSPDTDTLSYRKPGDTIDSILPMAEYLRRFRAGLDTSRALQGGEATETDLARQFLAAVSRRDTSALAALVVTRAEFGWLIFPDHRYAEQPYALDPALFWGQLTNVNARGIQRVLARHGGEPLTFHGMTCEADTLQMLRGPARIVGPCRVEYQAGDSLLTRQLFGSLVLRDGRVKLLSYANDF